MSITVISILPAPPHSKASLNPLSSSLQPLTLPQDKAQTLRQLPRPGSPVTGGSCHLPSLPCLHLILCLNSLALWSFAHTFPLSRTLFPSSSLVFFYFQFQHGLCLLQEAFPAPILWVSAPAYPPLDARCTVI
jgi:hypothetical protein